jgi:hypothetical protein
VEAVDRLFYAVVKLTLALIFLVAMLRVAIDFIQCYWAYLLGFSVLTILVSAALAYWRHTPVRLADSILPRDGPSLSSEKSRRSKGTGGTRT